MNRSSNFRRKLIYIVVLLAMLLPLYKLGQPSSGDSGGELSKLRHKYNISESDLGEISPASETMKLATLGLRGVAATLLWNRAHEYKVLHEWDRLKATLNNIALLQPHFEKVWEHQAHNLAYNVSTEFDDYRQRYEMVREGTEFLSRGVRQNREAPRLVWYTGWFYGSKMGTADEKRQFRRLFSEDDVLHESLIEQDIAVDSPEARGPLGKPDNWLVGRLWLNYGYELVDSGVAINRQTPLNFYETGPKWRIKHAESIEKEGILDDRAENAWQMASEDWARFGNRSIPTTSPFTIKLDGMDDLYQRREEKLEEFGKLTGDVFDQFMEERIATYPPKRQAILRKKAADQSQSERELVKNFFTGLNNGLESIARNSDPSVRLRAVQLIGELNDLDERFRKTDGYRTQINYAYWKALANAEQETRTVRARKLIYDAELANEEAELDKAIELYEEAFGVWQEIFDDYPILTIDDSAEDLYRSIRRYMTLIDSEDIPDDFPLKTFVEMMGYEGSVDPTRYAQIRLDAEEDLRKRKMELEAEELRRERELEEAAEKEQDQPEAEPAEESEEGSAEMPSEDSEETGPELSEVTEEN
ncbi:hypothetical protein LF1_42290 [Rubripirellula obstinata]|uniref:IRE (Iron responsive element) n=1 Tax=Rubripirellula obstinata TaxID=406547 RepID=A0A5B1CR01_9BACT|nr:IRE (iron responsive element) [Rubripirellula obstinata]KAA1261674.1 hypothetical protein LF1_42290 [Rubripirellula obstinata]